MRQPLKVKLDAHMAAQAKRFRRCIFMNVPPAGRARTIAAAQPTPEATMDGAISKGKAYFGREFRQRCASRLNNRGQKRSCIFCGDQNILRSGRYLAISWRLTVSYSYEYSTVSQEPTGAIAPITRHVDEQTPPQSGEPRGLIQVLRLRQSNPEIGSLRRRVRDENIQANNRDGVCPPRDFRTPRRSVCCA